MKIYFSFKDKSSIYVCPLCNEFNYWIYLNIPFYWSCYEKNKQQFKTTTCINIQQYTCISFEKLKYNGHSRHVVQVIIVF